MRILDCTRLFVGLTAVLLFSGLAAAQQTTQVETFTAGGVVAFSMQGTPAGGGVTFSTNATVQSINLAPGPVLFNGQPIDFAGHEPQWISSVYHGTLAIPVQAGPANVRVSGTGSGPGGGGGGCSVVGPSVNLGPNFSSTRLDVPLGGVNLTSVFPAWNSTVDPELNGHAVTLETTVTVTSVDAVNGLVTFNSNGAILARNAVVPALTTLGAICLAVGLFGLAIVAMYRRAPRGRDSSA